jgi:hypothetical protein
MGTVEPQHTPATGPIPAPAPKQKQMTRQQRRFIQRIEQEAHQTLNNLAGKFLEFFTDSDDPEGQEVVDKMNQLSAQWKVYCHSKQLNKEALPMVENYCKAVCEEYIKAKEPADLMTDEKECPQ